MGQDSRRAKSGPKHVRLYEWMLLCPAYRSLSIYARGLYTELGRRYTGTNNGNISLSYREAEGLLGCSNKPVPGAFRELQEKGFIKATARGSFSWKTQKDGSRASRATTWELTEHPVDWPVKSSMPATKEFMRWKPEKKTRHAESVPMDRRERAVSESMARRGRTNGTLKAGDEGQNALHNGTLRAGTYSIPDTGAISASERGPASHSRQASDARRSAEKEILGDWASSGPLIDHDPDEIVSFGAAFAKVVGGVSRG